MVRVAVFVALGSSIVSQIAVWIALESVGTPTNIVVMNPPVVNVVQHPPSPSPASIAEPALPVSSKLGEAVAHLHPAHRNAALVAAWNDRHAFVSRDGGKTFARVLDAPGVLVDVGFDRAGDVIALRGVTVGVLARRAEHWRQIPQLAAGEPGEPDARDATPTPRLIDGGADIVVVGSTHGDHYHSWVVASSDRGASWRFHELDRPYEASVARDRPAERRTA